MGAATTKRELGVGHYRFLDGSGDIFILCTHLTHGNCGKHRAHSAKRFAKEVSKLDPKWPIVITGDMNDKKDSSCFREMCSTGLEDAVEASESKNIAGSTFNGFKSGDKSK